MKLPIQYEKRHDGCNIDTYSLSLDRDKVIAQARMDMDDYNGSSGYTQWRVELPRNEVEIALAQAEEHGVGGLEILATVSKEWNNTWDNSRTNSGNKQYQFMVGLQLEQEDGKIKVDLKFQEDMHAYF